MSKVSYFTEEGLKKLQDEIHHLKTVERPSISKQIAEAREKGDLSENAEYDAAKEAQGLLEMKISKMEEQLTNARIIDKSKIDSSKVSMLSTVTIQNIKTKGLVTYTIVPDNEANIKMGKISSSTPIAQGLLGKKIGEKVEIKVPNGLMQFTIKDISI